MKTRVTVSLDENLVRIIDQRAGDIPRSRVVEKVLSKVFGDPKLELLGWSE